MPTINVDRSDGWTLAAVAANLLLLRVDSRRPYTAAEVIRADALPDEEDDPQAVLQPGEDITDDTKDKFGDGDNFYIRAGTSIGATVFVTVSA